MREVESAFRPQTHSQLSNLPEDRVPPKVWEDVTSTSRAALVSDLRQLASVVADPASEFEVDHYVLLKLSTRHSVDSRASTDVRAAAHPIYAAHFIATVILGLGLVVAVVLVMTPAVSPLVRTNALVASGLLVVLVLTTCVDAVSRWAEYKRSIGEAPQ